MAWGQAGARGIDDLVRRVAGNDPKLTSLTILRQRRFIHDDVASLASAMASNTHLQELYASGHALAPHTISLLADTLAASPNLRSLCVGDSSLGDEGVAALARGLAASSLTRLDLCNKGVGPRGAEALAGALAAAGPLTHLLLSSNLQLGDQGLGALCGAAGSSSSSTDSPAPAPTPALWAGLRVLEVQGCGITAAGVRGLAGSPNCGRLEVLRLDGNPLGPQAGEALGELLRAAPLMRELHLRDTQLGDEGGAALATSLAPAPPCTAAPAAAAAAGEGGGAGGDPESDSAAAPPRGQLAVLDVAECGLGPATMAALRTAFTRGARLEVLCLAGNPAISDADVAALASALAVERPDGAEAAAAASASASASATGTTTAPPQPPLAHLDLSGTAAGPEAVTALSEALGLRHVSLVGCPLRAAGAAALASSLAVNQSNSTATPTSGSTSEPRWASLEELCVSGTGLGVGDLEALFSALRAGGAPQLKSLEVGANPGIQEVEAFQQLMGALSAARPHLAVYWRAGDDPAPVVR